MSEQFALYLNQHKYQIISAIALILSPWILLFITISVADGSLATSRPLWSDELAYWHEIKCLYMKGLESGYHTVNGISPKLAAFSTHGFGSVLTYLPFAFVFGWNLNSIVIANTTYMSIAFLLFILLIKPSTKNTLLISIFYLTYMPLIMYAATSMTEVLNYAILVIYYTLFLALINGENHKKTIFAILLAFTIYMCFVRITYVVLLLPIALYYLEINKINKRLFICMAIWLLVSSILAPWRFRRCLKVYKSCLTNSLGTSQRTLYCSYNML